MPDGAVARRPIMGMFVRRVLGALVLDAATFEDVERDQTSTTQAMTVVVLSSVAGGIGTGGLYGPRPVTLVVSAAIALVAWAAWAMLTLQIGKQFLPVPQTRVDLGELLRTLGFAAAPGLFQVFAIVAPVPVFALTAVWMLAAMVVAVRQALDYSSTGRALAVCLVGWVLAITLAIGLSVLLSPPVS